MLGVGIAATLVLKINSRDKRNLFAYAIDLENENWTYAPKELDYGMTAEEVIKAERLLYDQAKVHMPENNYKTDIEGLLDFEDNLWGPWNKVVHGRTRYMNLALLKF